MKEHIEFKKKRELGDLLTDVFKFVRLEWRGLGSLMFRITGPALLVVVVCYIYYMQTTLGSFEMIFSSPSQYSGSSVNILLSILLLLFSVLVFYSLLYSTVLCYIKSYVDTKGNPVPRDVADMVRFQFWSMLGLLIIVGIIVFFGLMLCLLPGIYLGVCLAVSAPILIFEKKDILTTIGDCFKLIKGEWWITFATLIVIYLLYYVIMLVFQVPQYLYFFVKGITMSEQISGNPFEIIDWFSIALNVITMTVQYIFFSLVIVSCAFIYYNLNERKNYTGTIEAIEQLGKKE